MSVTRIVPNLKVADVGRAMKLYEHVFGLSVGMDLGWIGNLAPAETPSSQLQLMTTDASAPCYPDISVSVATPTEVDAIHERVATSGLEIVHPLTVEDWGCIGSFSAITTATSSTLSLIVDPPHRWRYRSTQCPTRPTIRCRTPTSEGITLAPLRPRS